MLCVEDTEVDLFSGIIEHGTGNLKIKPGKANIAMPTTPEELRLRHRRIGIAWLMVGSKNKNQSWITHTLLEAFRRFSDRIVGKHIAGFIQSWPTECQSTRRGIWCYLMSLKCVKELTAARWQAFLLARGFGKRRGILLS